ncbi:hypothetical protein ACWGH8_30950 [Nonomuraea muscovyensis]
MTAVVLATACALVYGTADFLGGLATRRSRVLPVVALSQTAGLALILALLPLLPGALSGQALLWGLGAGLAGAGGCCSTGRWPRASCRWSPRSRR